MPHHVLEAHRAEQHEPLFMIRVRTVVTGPARAEVIFEAVITPVCPVVEAVETVQGCPFNLHHNAGLDGATYVTQFLFLIAFVSSSGPTGRLSRTRSERSGRLHPAIPQAVFVPERNRGASRLVSSPPGSIMAQAPPQSKTTTRAGAVEPGLHPGSRSCVILSLVAVCPTPIRMLRLSLGAGWNVRHNRGRLSSSEVQTALSR